MGTIADKLTYLAGTKTAIKDAIEEKNVAVGNIPFRQYADKISLIGGGGESYKRPADWLTLPVLTAGQQKIVGLHAVFPHDSNFVAFTCEGAFTVDWGDGTYDNYNSGVTAYHVYNYNSVSEGTECSRGYRQVIVTITPQTGNNLTSVDFNCIHNQAYLQSYCTGWLDIKIAGAEIGRLAFSGSSVKVRHAMLEMFEFVGSYSITDFSYMFSNCYSLQSIPLLDTSSGTNFSYMFYGCYSLQSIPLLDTSSGTDFRYMFYGCYSLSAGALYGTSKSISYQACRLSRQALIDIFNGLSSGVSGGTITITNNWGVDELTSVDREIATNKGWTIAV